MSVPRLRARSSYLCELRLAPDERELSEHASHRLRRGTGPARRRSGQRQRLLQDVPVQLLGRSFGLDAELMAKDGDAVLVLAQSGAALSSRDVEAHQGSMDILVQSVQREQPARGANGRVDRSGTRLMLEEPGESLSGQFPEPLALGEEPLVERVRLRVEAGQKIALVERERLLQRCPTASADELLETRHIDVQPRGIQRHGVGVEHENAGTRKRAS